MPEDGLAVVRWHAAAIRTHDPDIALPLGASLVCGKLEETRGLAVVGKYSGRNVGHHRTLQRDHCLQQARRLPRMVAAHRTLPPPKARREFLIERYTKYRVLKEADNA